MKIQGWFPLGLTGLISLQSKGFSKSLLQHHSSKTSILWHSVFFMDQLSHWYITPGKTIPLTTQAFVSKVTSLLFNMLSRFFTASLPRSKCRFISQLQSWSVCSDFRAQENKIYHSFHFLPFYLPESDGTKCHDLIIFFNVEFQASFPPLLSHPD